MIQKWLSWLRGGLSQQHEISADFLMDDELDDLETDLPALARIIRAQQNQILQLNRKASMGVKLGTFGVFVLAVMGAWMFRYTPMPQPNNHGAVLLDRWTGDLLTVGSNGIAWFDVHSLKEKSGDH